MNITPLSDREAIRTFFSRRGFLLRLGVISWDEFHALRQRKWDAWSPDEWNAIGTWIAGWLKAKE